MPLYFVSGFIVSIAPFAVGMLGIIWFIIKNRYDYIIIIFLFTLILANNKSPVFISFENLRSIFLVVLLLLSGLIIFKEKGIDQRATYFLPFFTIALISSFLFSPIMTSSVFRVISYLALVVSIFVLAKYLIEDDRFNMYEHILALILITLLISLVGWILNPSLYLESGRLRGILGNPNFLGLYCVLAYAYADHFRTDESKFLRRDIFILKALILLCLFLTGSRNGYVSVALYITITVFLFKGISGKSVAIALAMGGFIVFTQLEVLTQFIPFLNELIRPDTLQSASGRSIVWPIAIEEILNQPWLGGGFTYNSYYMANFARSHNLIGVYWYGVWNTYLALLLDTGIIGLIGYLYFIYGVVKKNISFKIILPFLVMMIFTGFFESWAVSSLNPITPLFLLFFLLISIHSSKYENFSTA